MASRGRTAANALRMLGGCFKGASAEHLLKVARACVLPTMTFAAEAWWLPPKTTKKRMITGVDPMNKAWRAALRAALPVYKTTPVPLLHHAAGLPPVQQILDHMSRLHTARLHRLDPAHPLRIRTHSAHLYPKTRLAKTLDLLPAKMERANPLLNPPWVINEM